MVRGVAIVVVFLVRNVVITSVGVVLEVVVAVLAVVAVTVAVAVAVFAVGHDLVFGRDLVLTCPSNLYWRQSESCYRFRCFLLTIVKLIALCDIIC